MKKLGKVNKFRLIIDGKTHLNLSRSNYEKIVENIAIVVTVNGIISKMESDNLLGMTVNQYGYNLQVDRVK